MSARPRPSLTPFGIEEPWQVLLLLPVDFVDHCAIDRPVSAIPNDTQATLALTVQGKLSLTGRGGSPCVVCDVADSAGVVYPLTAFGQYALWEARLAPGSVVLRVEVRCSFDRRMLTAIGAPSSRWHGRVQPRYPSKPHALSGDALHDRIAEELAGGGLALAVDHVTRHLSRLGEVERVLWDLGADGWSIEDLVRECHDPTSVRHGAHARTVMLRVAALAAFDRMSPASAPVARRRFAMPTLRQRIGMLPFTATADQNAAIFDIASRLGSTQALQHVVFGDVGTGKTAVAGVIAAAVADDGGRVVILSPNTLLARQFHGDLAGWFPDLELALVTGDSTADAGGARVVVGTSALLHRDTGPLPFDLVIVDELHRWSRAQREQHARAGTHRLELSATPIPRTQALLRFNAASQSVLRTTPYPKSIETRLHEGRNARGTLFGELQAWIRDGERLLVVYPRREPNADNDTEADRLNVAEGGERWARMFPGMVGTLTALDSEDVKRERLAAFSAGMVRILVCTTVVEMGINLPELRRIVVVSPHLLGLMSLHQLRGRVARRGGEGWCDLYAQESLRPDQRKRLLQFARIGDGHAIAELDLQLRGCGDIGVESSTQSGADRILVYGQGPDTGLLDAVWPVFERLGGGGDARSQ